MWQANDFQTAADMRRDSETTRNLRPSLFDHVLGELAGSAIHGLRCTRLTVSGRSPDCQDKKAHEHCETDRSRPLGGLENLAARRVRDWSRAVLRAQGRD